MVAQLSSLIAIGQLESRTYEIEAATQTTFSMSVRSRMSLSVGSDGTLRNRLGLLRNG
jgi:hypothetical protein